MYSFKEDSRCMILKCATKTAHAQKDILKHTPT
jgi:hypothetical protein